MKIWRNKANTYISAKSTPFVWCNTFPFDVTTANGPAALQWPALFYPPATWNHPTEATKEGTQDSEGGRNKYTHFKPGKWFFHFCSMPYPLTNIMKPCILGCWTMAVKTQMVLNVNVLLVSCIPSIFPRLAISLSIQATFPSLGSAAGEDQIRLWFLKTSWTVHTRWEWGRAIGKKFEWCLCLVNNEQFKKVNPLQLKPFNY